MKCLKFPSHGILWHLGVGDMKTSRVESGTLEVCMLRFQNIKVPNEMIFGDGNTLLATKLHCIGNMIMPDKRESQRTEDIQRQE